MQKNLYLMIFVYQSWYKKFTPKSPSQTSESAPRPYLFLPIDMRHLVNYTPKKDNSPV